MTVVTVVSGKGGSGASLVATNLAIALARQGDCLLVDLHSDLGTDDLLLDLAPSRSWVDLLPVGGELTPHHLELALTTHASGVRFLASPKDDSGGADPQQSEALLRVLSERFTWLVLDTPVGLHPLTSRAISLSDRVLLVTTTDPPALRNANRLLAAFSEDMKARTGLVLNQTGRAQPASPATIAAGLGSPLLAALPSDSRAVGYQIHFGRPCVLDNRSALGRAIFILARRLAVMLGQGRRSQPESLPG